jgi:signal transduction histidine kinase
MGTASDRAGRSRPSRSTRQLRPGLVGIEDDGVGFEQASADTPHQGFGLLGMQERAALVGATVQIESAAGEGTTIIVRMPMVGQDVTS